MMTYTFHLQAVESDLLQGEPSTSSNTIFLEDFLDLHPPSSNIPSLSMILQFVTKINEMHATSNSVTLLARSHTTSWALLVGSYLILMKGISVDEAMQRLSPVSADFSPFQDNIRLVDSLSAIQHSKCRGWLSIASTATPYLLRELVRLPGSPAKLVSQSTNGNYHVVVPGKLIVHGGAHDGDHSFTTAPSAAELTGLGVCLVVCLGRRLGDAGVSTLASQGIRVAHLLHDGQHMLQALDTLLAILRCTSGVVAVCGGAARQAAPLMAACLISGSGFEAAAAVAWLRMTCATPAAGSRACRTGGLAGRDGAGWSEREERLSGVGAGSDVVCCPMGGLPGHRMPPSDGATSDWRAGAPSENRFILAR